MMAAIEVREEGVGRTGVDSGGGRIYSMHKTLCTVVDRGVSGHHGAGRCMYVLMRCSMATVILMRIDMELGR